MHCCGCNADHDELSDRKRVKHKMDHLVCFVPAMLALGSHTGAVSGRKADQYMQLAENLTETCWQFYAVQPTGQLPLQSQHQSNIKRRVVRIFIMLTPVRFLPAFCPETVCCFPAELIDRKSCYMKISITDGFRIAVDPSVESVSLCFAEHTPCRPITPNINPCLASAFPTCTSEMACSWQSMTVGLSPEYVTFHEGRGMRSSVHVYLMRPEAVEAFFVLWRLTGNTKYREYGWGVFQAIEKWCKVGARSWLVCLSGHLESFCLSVFPVPCLALASDVKCKGVQSWSAVSQLARQNRRGVVCCLAWTLAFEKYKKKTWCILCT